MKTSLFFLTLFIFKANGDTLFKELSIFCGNNGHKYVDVTFVEKTLMEKFGKQAMISLAKHDIFSKISYKIGNNMVDFEIDTQVLVTDLPTLLNTIERKKIMKAIENHRVKKTMLLLQQRLSKEMEAKLVETIRRSIGFDAYFYIICYVSEHETVLYRAISLKNSPEVVIEPLIFEHDAALVESYNLGGQEIASITDSWSPYIKIEGCNEDGSKCNTTGYLTDMFDAVKKILNSTWTTHKQLDGNWGIQPVSGPFNRSGVWNGVFGKVVNKQYPISINFWVNNIERRGLVDLVSFSDTRTCLVLMPQMKGIDPGLFVRPFRKNAWLALGITFITLLAMNSFPYRFIPFYGNTYAQRFVVLIGWILFVLVNAWFSGALTMFLTSERTLPFESIYDVMRSYPDWKLMMKSGYDIYFLPKVLQDDIEYIKFWERVQENPEETVFQTITEGMNKILMGQFVIYLERGQLLGYIKANPSRNQKLKVFGCSMPDYSSGVIISNNSPLKPILEFVSKKLLESETKDILFKKWFGQTKYKSGGLKTMVLSGGQVILAFIILLSCVSFAFITVILEILYSKCILIEKWRKN